jgi:hypothetical protein
LQPNYSSIVEHCNLWRNFDDIQDSWASLESIIDYYGNNQDIIVPNAGPGHWNDPDMVRMLSYSNPLGVLRLHRLRIKRKPFGFVSL